MNILNRFLSHLGLGKEKTVDDTADISTLDTAVSADMKTQTDIWWNAFQNRLPKQPTHENFRVLPMVKLSTSYITRLMTSELKYELTDETLNGYVKKNLLPKMDRIVQYALIGGYSVIKPYIKPNGAIFFDHASSRSFLPQALDENGNITEGTFRQLIRYNKKTYERREHHRYADGVHYITNTAWLYNTRQQVQLSDIPMWADIMEQGAIPSDMPLIVTYRMPYVNNIDLDSPLPVSIYAGSIDTLHEINVAYSEYLAEFRKKSAKVFGDSGIFSKDGKITDDYFVNIQGDGVRSVNEQIMSYSPDIREADLKAGLDTQFRLYESQLGVSTGTFSFDTRKGLVTATQVLSEDKTTYDTIKQLQAQLKPALEALAHVTAILAQYYGMDATDEPPAIEFGDSVFEDTGTEFNRRMQLAQAGMLKPELVNAWYFGVPEDKAREMLPDMAQTFGGDE